MLFLIPVKGITTQAVVQVRNLGVVIFGCFSTLPLHQQIQSATRSNSFFNQFCSDL